MAEHTGWGPQGPQGPHGAYGPYGPYGGWAPPPPKPGVVPLAPFGVGEVLGGSFSALGRGFGALLGVSSIAGLVVVVFAAGTGLLAGWTVWDQARAVFDPPYGTDPSTADVTATAVAFGLWFLAVSLVGLAALALVHAACLVVLQDTVLGLKPRFGEVWRRSTARFWAVLRLQLLLGLVLLVPYLLIMGIGAAALITTGDDRGPSAVAVIGLVLALLALGVAMCWLFVRFSMAASVVVLEGGPAVPALRRSARLVRGVWWRTFGIQLLVYVIASVMGYMVSLPFTYGGVLGALAMAPEDTSDPSSMIPLIAVAGVLYLIGTVLSTLVNIVFPVLATGLLYVDRRIRTEDLAPGLMAAAGVQPPPGYRPPAPPQHL
ncbi:hypothetical protein [Streptomyces sp. NPDC060194]|uniref:DUF7847 domain-containing protein n=1 Tax=Streptomyces sp. NPDC060194 TaxID=3347069 RepID=UPI0036552961